MTMSLSANDPTISFSKWKNGQEWRLTPENYDNSLTKTIFEQLHSTTAISALVCGEYNNFQLPERIISVYRLCGYHNIDWLIISETPRWDYFGFYIIALISAFVASLIVTAISILLNIYVSFKIVSPLYIMLQLFERVSKMELDGLSEQKSFFSEFQILFKQFNQMVKKMKLYRAFIPAHLISEIDKESLFEFEKPQMKQVPSKKVLDNNDKDETMSMVSQESQLSFLRRAHPAHNKFSLYLEKRMVSFVFLYLEDLSKNLREMGFKEVLHFVSDIFEQLDVVSRTSGGQVGPFENDTFQLSFNAANNQSNHEKKALSACTLLQKRMDTLKEKKMSESSKRVTLTLFPYRMCVLTQDCCCGNVGTRASKNFTIISSVRHNAELLLQIAYNLDVLVVVSDKFYNSSSTDYQMRYIATQRIVSDSFYTWEQRATEPNQTHNIRVYELGEDNHVGMDEWMYELEQKERKNTWTKYRQACKLFFDGKYEDALVLFEDFNTNFKGKNLKDDRPSLEMIKSCRKYLLDL